MKYILPDDPTLVDRLERETLCEQVSEVVRAITAPAVIGIHGDWGSGKTSFLKRMAQNLERPQTGKAPNVICVWFDAWRYQAAAVPAVALLHRMRDELSL